MRLLMTDDDGAVTTLAVDTRDLSRFRDVQEREGWGDLSDDPIRGAARCRLLRGAPVARHRRRRDPRSCSATAT